MGAPIAPPVAPLPASAVLYIQPRHEGSGGFWARLADPLTGMAQPEWTLFLIRADLEAYAASWQVPIHVDPETGEETDR